MIFLGYLSAILMGLTLGLVGAGGSILTVPILVYFFAIKPYLATTYSLLIVGLTALFGAIIYYQKNLVRLQSALIFVVPSTIAVIATRSFFIPFLPESILAIPKDNFLLLVFSSLMLSAALFMLNPMQSIKKDQLDIAANSVIKLVMGSLAVGFFTGLVGVGGGFLIVPTLIILFALKAKEAIGTSLAIIAANALIGFKSDLLLGIKIDWIFLASISALTLVGMLGGTALSKKIDGNKLKKLFALIVSVIAIFIFLQQLYLLTSL